MSMGTNELLPQTPEERFLHIPYKARHEQLKPVIVRLYMGNYGDNGKRTSMNQIVAFMRENYLFHATATQYKNWLRKWGIRLNTSIDEKKIIVITLARQKRPLDSTTNVTLGEGEGMRELDKKQMKRYLKHQINHHQVEAASPGIISMWNLPYTALIASIKRPGQPSPFNTTPTTPNYLNIPSPVATSPKQAAAPSPTMQFIQTKVIQDRSNLLLQGRRIELLQLCKKEDQIILTNYFHDLYIHSYVTAKYWGKGPTTWTWEMISALTRGAFDPGSSTSPEPATFTATASPGSSFFLSKDIQAPSNLCRWAIHVEHVAYEPIFEHDLDEPQVFDVENPSSWREWEEAVAASSSILDSIQDSIFNSSFSATRPEILPVCNRLIAQSLQESPVIQVVEACKFAIMAGNADAIESIFNDNKLPDDAEFYPLHLAAYYLDGGNKCCIVIKLLLESVPSGILRDRKIDNFGHTVFDSLIVSILRSHTNLSPANINRALGKSNTFPGEEKDICGRWDADSPEIRDLFQRGYSRIPNKWKHPFCHSSVQAVCHALIQIHSGDFPPHIDAPSGLFARRCIRCGLELKLGPIHLLILVAFHLSQHGMRGETLFGVVAIIVCLIRLGADPSLKFIISLQGIIQGVDPDMCQHSPIDAYELLMAVPERIVAKWSKDCRTGWESIRQVLRLAMYGDIFTHSDLETEPTGFCFRSIPRSPDQSLRGENSTKKVDDSMDFLDNCWMETKFEAHLGGWPCGNPKLGLLWATIQTELLTYRRVQEAEPWISRNFSTKALLDWLQGKSEEFDIPLVEKKMMKESHTVCGWFESDYLFSPVASDVCTEYFMNMDIYSRASYIPAMK